MVLFAASRRNNFVGGTCALTSALLVKFCIVLLITVFAYMCVTISSVLSEITDSYNFFTHFKLTLFLIINTDCDGVSN